MKVLRSIVRYTSLAVILIVVVVAAQAQLPPASQKALDAGIASAKAGDFPAAIKMLTDARKLAPDAPSIYFNLGLAESKIPGHEARAICALEAYLALSPDAANVAAVRKAIDNLEAAARSNVDKMIEVLKVGFVGLSGDQRAGLQPEVSLPVLFLKLGQQDNAEATIASIKRGSPNDARLGLINVYLLTGHFDAAEKEFSRMKKGDTSYDYALTGMIRAYIAAARFREAKAYLAKRNNTDGYLLLDLAVAESKAGMTEDAEARFQDAKLSMEEMSKRYNDSFFTIRDMPDLAYARWRMGQKDVAESIFRDMLSRMDTYTGKSPNAAKVRFIVSYSSTLEMMGRHAEAVKIMDKAEKYWQAQMRNAEEGIGVYGESTTIYNQYRWLNEWDRMQKFVTRNLDINKNFADGMTGMTKFFKSLQTERAEAARIKAATDGVNKLVADSSATPAQRAAMWMQYSDSFLTAPIFTTDFNVMLRNLVDYTPPADNTDKPQAIFAHVEEPAEAIVDAINNIRAMREKKQIITVWTN